MDPHGRVLAWGRHRLDLGGRALVMGIINVTPDSFSDGGQFARAQSAIAQGLACAQAGADILDIGGESTRPGADPLGLEEELARVIPVIESLARQVEIPISIDTYKAQVARAAIEAGASIINDISAGRMDEEMFPLAARTGAPLVLMHMQGRPKDMQRAPSYQDVVGEVAAFLAQAAGRAEAQGVAREMIILDPGLGFGKTFDHNLALLNNLDKILALGRLVLVGHSRKAFIGQALGGRPPEGRLDGTTAVAAIAAYQGAHIVRVHQVGPALDAVRLARAVRAERVE